MAVFPAYATLAAAMPFLAVWLSQFLPRFTQPDNLFLAMSSQRLPYYHHLTRAPLSASTSTKADEQTHDKKKKKKVNRDSRVHNIGQLT